MNLDGGHDPWHAHHRPGAAARRHADPRPICPTSVKRTHLGLLDLAGTHAAKAGEVVLVTRFSDRSSVRPNETGDMLLGISLDQVTACVTINAATIWSAVYDPEPT